MLLRECNKSEETVWTKKKKFQCTIRLIASCQGQNHREMKTGWNISENIAKMKIRLRLIQKRKIWKHLHDLCIYLMHCAPSMCKAFAWPWVSLYCWRKILFTLKMTCWRKVERCFPHISYKSFQIQRDFIIYLFPFNFYSNQHFLVSI